MLKAAILASSALLASPCLAQTTAPAMQTVPGQLAPSGQQPSPDQVAHVVDQQFASHDTDGDGALSKAEFAAWMVALKARSDPTAAADSPRTRTWVNNAFAMADTDRSSAVSKPELLGFLNQGHS